MKVLHCILVSLFAAVVATGAMAETAAQKGTRIAQMADRADDGFGDLAGYRCGGLPGPFAHRLAPGRSAPRSSIARRAVVPEASICSTTNISIVSRR